MAKTKPRARLHVHSRRHHVRTVSRPNKSAVRRVTKQALEKSKKKRNAQ